MTALSSSQARADVTTIFIDAQLPPDDLNELLQRNELRLTIAEPIVDDKSVTRTPQDIADAQILLCTYLPANLAEMHRLEFVQLASSGYSQALGLGLPANGVRVSNARGVNDTAIAEWNIAMMICLARNFKQINRNQLAHRWDRAAQFQTEIRGATVGLWGYGGIARQTARLCNALGLKIHVLARAGVGPARNIYHVPDTGDTEGNWPDRVFSIENRFEFLKSLDFLILCLPLNSQTEGIVGEREFGALPGSAYVLNPARGPLIQQAALLQALRERWIAGAALDTHYKYPLPSTHPLWDFENVILTPHISGSSGSPLFQRRLADLFLQNVDRYLREQPLLNQLSREELVD